MKNRFWLQVSYEIVHPFAKDKSAATLIYISRSTNYNTNHHLGHIECHEEVGY